jgi:hypothetical protein
MEVQQWLRVCHDYGVPFAAVRTGWANQTDDSAHVDFNAFSMMWRVAYAGAITCTPYSNYYQIADLANVPWRTFVWSK